MEKQCDEYQVAADKLAMENKALRDALALAKDLTTIVRMPNVEYIADAHNKAIEQAEEVEPLTNSYVQHVPDKCDRIIWRNQYIHLPPTAPAQQPVKVAQTFHSNGKPKGYVLLKQPQRTGE
jgi:hypothetical protein